MKDDIFTRIKRDLTIQTWLLYLTLGGVIVLLVFG
jgi:hypothetical protein